MPMADQLIRVYKFTTQSFRSGSFSADTYQAISKERYPGYFVLLVHVVCRLLMSLCRFSVHGACVAAVSYCVYDALCFLLERRMGRTLRPHEDALLDFATSMLVREAFKEDRVLFASAVGGLGTFGLNAGLRLWAYFHRDKGTEAKAALA